VPAIPAKGRFEPNALKNTARAHILIAYRAFNRLMSIRMRSMARQGTHLPRHSQAPRTLASFVR
jgi:hypothetical protein